MFYGVSLQEEGVPYPERVLYEFGETELTQGQEVGCMKGLILTAVTDSSVHLGGSHVLPRPGTGSVLQ